MEERLKIIREGTIEKDTYQKFKTALGTLQDNESGNSKLRSLASIYYNNALGEIPWSSSQHNYDKIGTFEQRRSFVLELCAEAINRDMITYIRTGKRGDLGSKMYKIVK